ncbi:MAG: helix-turn-helix transcriptional regulator [Clostridiales bacterium]|nr:helix-turn-helix transcriptional regulator [Clostridiales bacterium]
MGIIIICLFGHVKREVKFLDIFSARLRELRKAKKWTQEEAAKQFDVPLRTYCRYESGERETPFPIAVRIADVFQVSLDYLAGRTNQRERQALGVDGGDPQ